MASRALNTEDSRVLVVGDVMLDRYWFGEVERISPEAPVPIVRVTGEEFRLGGAANVAANICSIGAKAALISAVGRDEASVRLAGLLEEHGIKPLLSSHDALKTIVKLRVSGRSQQLLRIDFDDRPASHMLTELSDNFERQIGDYDVVIFSDYGKGGLAQIARKIAYARQIGKPVLVDPKGDDYSAYRGATVVTPNRAELARVIGAWDSEEQMVERAQNLRTELKLDALLVTRSEEGMSLFDSEGHLRVPAEAREVFDVTGAGDTVIAILGVMIGLGMPIREAIGYANRAAGIVVGKFGTAVPTREELFA
ncbi:D-glycero-beta-D-manno-heptose-7-phosphate kinase [Sphingomonas kyeonggiensis]|uniref:RfaE bifunctional protein kinase chain/domain n=1 Tax=Sphingomonas kyeonggiensis TaxID=1268553 RepID=A0A7W6JUT2_9SPHN|nr:D-glycero-beta-D-manno-heptose-7-phosphate kinase [Sphingomonas kyeonggiensis]MBB4099945.1 rfaE bifunctional protein kinase chain/domain [Sphingomonas kyeonggiensis]